jgi:hypothetical protein
VMAGKVKDILVACHSEKFHVPLSLYLPSDPDTPVPLVAEYVDPSTGTREWEDIPPASKDIIWTVSCPLYLPFSIPTTIHYEGGMSIFKNIFEDGWNILRPGGSVVIRIQPSMLTKMGIPTLFKNFESAVRKSPDIRHPWELSFVLPSDLPFIIAKPGQQREAITYVLLTKPSAGGRRRGQRSTRRGGRAIRSRKVSRPSTRRFLRR